MSKSEDKKVTELQNELNLAREMYPKQMKMVKDTLETVDELSCIPATTLNPASVTKR